MGEEKQTLLWRLLVVYLAFLAGTLLGWLLGWSLSDAGQQERRAQEFMRGLLYGLVGGAHLERARSAMADDGSP